jgi:hypothetical protein
VIRQSCLLRAMAAALTLGMSGAAPDAAGQPAQRLVPLLVNDLVADPVSGRLFASIPGRAGAPGNSVVAIDPSTGAVGAPIFVGSEPDDLVVSEDGQFLYVTLRGAAAVRRVDLASGVAGPYYWLANGGGFLQTPLFADRVLPVPGHPEAIAVTHRDGAGNRYGVTLYDAAGPRPLAINSRVQSAGVLDGTTLLVAGAREAYRVTIDAAGLTVGPPTELVEGLEVMAVSGAEVFTSDGRVIDPATWLETRRRAISGAAFDPVVVRPDAARGRLYAFIDGALRVLDLRTFDTLETLPLNRAWGRPESLAVLGGGVAYHTSAGVVLVGDFSQPAPLPPERSVPEIEMELAGCVICRAGQTFRALATVTNPSPHAVAVEVKATLEAPSGSRQSVDALFGSRHLDVIVPAAASQSVQLLGGAVPPSAGLGVWRVAVTLADPVTGRTLSTSSRTFRVTLF